MDLVASGPDGSELAWTEETAVAGETASYVVAAPAGASGAVLLSGRVRFENSDGRVLQSRRLRGSFVAAAGGVYSAAEGFAAPVGVGLIHDPHDGKVADEEAP
jgi:hypothetical protein